VAAEPRLAGASFWKMSGGGNDFVVFDDRARWFPTGRPAAVAALCARATGVGADAVLLLQEPSTADALFRMTYFNADGSEAPMCGNGALCIARFARERGLAAPGGDVVFETGAGLYRARLGGGGSPRVRLAMRDPGAIAPALPAIQALGYARAGFADTGTPHLVALVPDVAGVDVPGEGRRLREHEAFGPEGLNVDFVHVVDRRTLRLRTYERGVEAETLSCGTGATAAAILCFLWGLVEPPVRVRPPGGIDLEIGFQQTGPSAVGEVTLEGEARIAFSGELPAAG
jgi:diaminopimelate epimerase